MKKDVLGGKYRLHQVIGKGGSGSVYLAVDYAVGKLWAIKELPQTEALVLNEVEMLRTLEHPMLPRIIDRIEEDEKVYLVMDYLKGISLQRILHQREQFSTSQVLRWGLQLCDVLGYLHTHEPPVIYRDMKPGNILLTKSAELKLIDFGCAQFYRGENEATTVVAVTPGYTAPEQYDGTYNVLTDIYSLGATIRAICPKNIPRELTKIIAKCQQEEPTKRYQSVKSVSKALRRLQRKKSWGLQMGKLMALALTLGFLGHNIGGILAEARSRAYLWALTRSQYEAAVEIFPEREEPYLEILKSYKHQSKTQEGIAKVENLLHLYAKDDHEKQRIYLTIGKLYFTGNIFDESFAVDYEAAYQYFERVSKETYPYVAWYQKVSRTLCDFGTEIDWQQMRSDLLKMEEVCQKMTDIEEKIAGYQATAAVYLANRYYLGESEPIKEGIRLLEKCRDLLKESTKLPTKVIILAEVNMRIARGYTLAGLQQNDEELLATSYNLYEELLANQTQASIRLEIMQKLAYLKRYQDDYLGAAAWYEMALKENPEDVETYCQYILMKLLEEKDVQAAKALFGKVNLIPEHEKSQNYQILKIRLEAII